MAVPISSA